MFPPFLNRILEANSHTGSFRKVFLSGIRRDKEPAKSNLGRLGLSSKLIRELCSFRAEFILPHYILCYTILCFTVSYCIVKSDMPLLPQPPICSKQGSLGWSQCSAVKLPNCSTFAGLGLQQQNCLRMTGLQKQTRRRQRFDRYWPEKVSVCLAPAWSFFAGVAWSGRLIWRKGRPLIRG